MTDMEAACVVDCRDRLGEGIFWCPEEKALYWLDLPMPSRLHRLDPRTGGHRIWNMPDAISTMAKRKDGSLLIASHHGLNIFEPEAEDGKGALRRVAAPEASIPQNRSNDGTTDAKGRFWYGTMRNNIGPGGENVPITESAGTLYKVESDFRVVPIEGGIGIPNSSAFSPDYKTFYFCDTMRGSIEAYDFDLEIGALSNKRLFANPEGLGHPDGSTIDSEGGLWNARWEGSCVIRFAPDGRIDQIVKIPAARVTCCAFGGEALDTLYVTTSRAHLSDAELETQPQAGGLFAVKTGFSGVPRPAFGG
ncbi:MAG TPA: SMP-30/gluconolactonase/LRE family protein [Dongiaceae bacterium]|jgi:sugar lactone lactonase YvrE